MRYSIRLHPGASQNKLLKDPVRQSIDVYVTKKPYHGQANQALKELLAEEFDVAPSRIKIVQGEKSRFKIVEIE
ncbi:MAG: DUF167 domain-containing protein [Candidatus Omnitrophota bacterium]